MSKDKKYDIGHGVTIRAGSWGIRAEWFTDEAKKCSRSIGISWPINPPEQVEITWSRAGGFYYPSGIAVPLCGFWLSKLTFPTLEAVQSATPNGIFGKAYAQFKEQDGTEYYRSCLMFNGWDVKSSPETTLLSREDPLVLDYAGLVGNQWEEQEAEFNEAIAFTGRTARDIISKIYPFTEEPEEEPPAIPI